MLDFYKCGIFHIGSRAIVDTGDVSALATAVRETYPGLSFEDCVEYTRYLRDNPDTKISCLEWFEKKNEMKVDDTPAPDFPDMPEWPDIPVYLNAEYVIGSLEVKAELKCDSLAEFMKSIVDLMDAVEKTVASRCVG